MSKLAFMIAGVQKCGTTALDAYLRQHPALSLASPKETHFFDSRTTTDWSDPDYEVLHACFGPSQRGLRGESTPSTLYWTPAHGRIARYNPDMKFILLFRHPTDRAWAHWSMVHGRGHDTLDFSEAIRSGRGRVKLEGEEPGYSRRHSYVERGLYAQQVRALQSVFPPDQMLFLDQRSLRNEPTSTVNRVAAFLGVDHLSEVHDGTHNPSRVGAGRMNEADAAYLNGLYANDQAQFETLTGLRLANCALDTHQL